MLPTVLCSRKVVTVSYEEFRKPSLAFRANAASVEPIQFRQERNHEVKHLKV